MVQQAYTSMYTAAEVIIAYFLDQHYHGYVHLNTRFVLAISIATIFEFVIIGCVLGFQGMKLLDFKMLEVVAINKTKLL